MSTAYVLDEVEAPPPILDAEHYEIIDGERVETPRMGVYEGWIASILDHAMGPFARANELGRVAIEVMFALGEGTNKRRPDLAFVSYERWPRSTQVPRRAAWEVAPDLAVEVVIPSNTAAEIVRKKGEYFRAGVVAVWVIYPEEAEIHVWDSAIACRVLEMGDVLEGGTVLPGFRLAVAELFDVETEPAA